MKLLSRSVLLAVVVAMLAAGCSSSDDTDSADGEAGGTTTTTTTAEEDPVAFEPHVPTDVAAPEAEGNGVNVPQPASPLPDGYVMEEYLVGGTATSFEPVDTPADGRWVAEPGDEAEYRTRVIVRRPERAEDFSGTVVVEWFNISAIEAAPDWAYLAEEISREGHAYVGVSAQAQGVEGGQTLLDVEVDEGEAAEAGVSTDQSGLRNVDPARYGTLRHPGDAYSFDIFSQVGRLVDGDPQAILGDLEPERVIAAGESQSGSFLATVINAVHPLAPVFDGFLVHSRPAMGAPLDGDYTTSREAVADLESADVPSGAVRIRDDLDVPVMMFATETDLTTLRYATVRQPDTDLIRTWEVAGTAHADAHLLRAVVGGPRDPMVGDLLGCGAINTGPQKEVLSAAFNHLVGWVAGGDPPPAGERIEMTDGDEAIARDDLGMALGGVRNPLIDVPVFVPIGDRVTAGETLSGGDICALMGSTRVLDAAELAELHGTADDYVDAFSSSADAMVDAGFLLAPDADDLVAEAEENRTRF
ncbi:MAG: hypothetical protein GX643_06755 [Acidimicrobiales bacterium]|nr:hypothetical protein [Acidimicrobiales bacterium]